MTFTPTLLVVHPQPDITRDRMIIETMESILGEAGKIVVVDQSNNVLSLLDLSEDQPEISVRQGGEQ